MERPLFSAANLATLLGRAPRAIPTAEGAARLRGARVLVTGAAGSVGTALVMRLIDGGAGRVIALDSHEATLFALGRLAGADAPLDLRLGDVRHADKLRRVFQESRPEVVFHLA